jgi:hypothetical protein
LAIASQGPRGWKTGGQARRGGAPWGPVERSWAGKAWGCHCPCPPVRAAQSMAFPWDRAQSTGVSMLEARDAGWTGARESASSLASRHRRGRTKCPNKPVLPILTNNPNQPNFQRQETHTAVQMPAQMTRLLHSQTAALLTSQAHSRASRKLPAWLGTCMHIHLNAQPPACLRRILRFCLFAPCPFATPAT